MQAQSVSWKSDEVELSLSRPELRALGADMPREKNSIQRPMLASDSCCQNSDMLEVDDKLKDASCKIRYFNLARQPAHRIRIVKFLITHTKY